MAAHRLIARMLLDPTRFSFLPPLEAAFATIRDEVAGLAPTLFTPWPDRGAYLGDWVGVPLFMNSHPHEVDKVFARNQAAMPATMRVLRAIPAIVAAGVSSMQPGCHILPHVDTKPEDVLRAHLGLRVPKGARFRVGADQHGWRDGECLIFDGTLDHETINPGPGPRVVLLVDARLNADELAYLRSTQTATA